MTHCLPNRPKKAADGAGLLANDSTTQISKKHQTPSRQPDRFQGGHGVRHQPTRLKTSSAKAMSTKSSPSHTLAPCIAMNSVTSCGVVLATAVRTMALAGLAP